MGREICLRQEKENGCVQWCWDSDAHIEREVPCARLAGVSLAGESGELKGNG